MCSTSRPQTDELPDRPFQPPRPAWLARPAAIRWILAERLSAALHRGPGSPGRPYSSVLSEGRSPLRGPAVWWFTDPLGLKFDEPRVRHPAYSISLRPRSSP